MGTHPIFESDFDCLTEKVEIELCVCFTASKTQTMIKLFSLKQQKKEDEERGVTSQKKTSAAQLRITKDINDLTLPPTCKTDFEDPDDLLNFKLTICPDEGFLHRRSIYL